LFDVITFDLWQTLLIDSLGHGIRRGELRLSGVKDELSKAGKTYSESELTEAYSECITQCRSLRSDNRDMHFDRQVKIFLDLLEPDLSETLEKGVFDSVTEIYSDAFFLSPPVLHDNCLEVLSKIKDMGLKIALISNTGMTPGVAFRRFLRETGALDFFEETVFSDEELLSKPSPEIFHRTLLRVEGRASMSVHVGDSIQHDVLGAHLAGMKAIWIEGFSERGDLSDPKMVPDVTVADLAQVPDALVDMLG
tara:strand:- start:5780 stop:6532 length:753 start_codon:yes stop_codon:yes gene_type:complete